MSRSDIGVLLESSIFSGLLKRKKEMDSIHYWRTKDDAEVDFIYHRGNKLLPIEVKSKARKTRSLYNFLTRYNLKQGFIAHLGAFQEGALSYIPAFWLA